MRDAARSNTMLLTPRRESRMERTRPVGPAPAMTTSVVVGGVGVGVGVEAEAEADGAKEVKPLESK